MKIVFVCTGNTCRSPMAEAFLKLIAKNNNKTDIQVISRGLAADEGSGASEFSSLAAKEYGADLSGHVSTQLTVDDIFDADLILTVTGEHSAFLKNELKKVADKIFSIGEYVNCDDISDPYGGNLETYKACADALFKACEKIYKKISGND